MKTYYITNETVRAACARAVTILPLGYTVIFKEEDEKRTAAQRGLYRVWLRSLSHQTGYTEEELHERFKSTYMRQIYMEQPEKKEQIEWVDRLKKMEDHASDIDKNSSLGKDEKHEVHKVLADYRESTMHSISTEWATIAQYREYLDRIEKFCISKELQLPASSYYNEAMK